MDALFNSLDFSLFRGYIFWFANFWLTLLQTFDMTVFLGIYLLLFIYSPTEILYSNFENWGVVGVAVRYVGHTERLDFPVPYWRGYGAIAASAAI